MIAKAVSAAIDDCISENILYDFLTEYRKEVQDMCTVEYYEQLHNDSTRQEGFDEGYNTSQKEIITNALDNGRTPEQISDFTGIDLKIVQEVADKAKELADDLRRKVTVKELMDETGWDEDKIRTAIKFSGDNIEDLDSGEKKES